MIEWIRNSTLVITNCLAPEHPWKTAWNETSRRPRIAKKEPSMYASGVEGAAAAPCADTLTSLTSATCFRVGVLRV